MGQGAAAARGTIQHTIMHDVQPAGAAVVQPTCLRACPSANLPLLPAPKMPSRCPLPLPPPPRRRRESVRVMEECQAKRAHIGDLVRQTGCPAAAAWCCRVLGFMPLPQSLPTWGGSGTGTARGVSNGRLVATSSLLHKLPHFSRPVSPHLSPHRSTRPRVVRRSPSWTRSWQSWRRSARSCRCVPACRAPCRCKLCVLGSCVPWAGPVQTARRRRNKPALHTKYPPAALRPCPLPALSDALPVGVPKARPPPPHARVHHLRQGAHPRAHRDGEGVSLLL